MLSMIDHNKQQKKTTPFSSKWHFKQMPKQRTWGGGRERGWGNLNITRDFQIKLEDRNKDNKLNLREIIKINFVKFS